MLPLAGRRIVSILVACVTLGFLAAMAYGSIPLLRMSSFQASPAMGMPMWIAYACLPIGAFYVTLELLVSVARNWASPFAPPQEGELPVGDVS
jgi:TRAP-type C4-dicarboxylate transport system permease small subunit